MGAINWTANLTDIVPTDSDSYATIDGSTPDPTCDKWQAGEGDGRTTDSARGHQVEGTVVLPETSSLKGLSPRTASRGTAISLRKETVIEMTSEPTVNETDECEKCRHPREKHKGSKGACTDDVVTERNQHGEGEAFEPCECPFFHQYPAREK